MRARESLNSLILQERLRRVGPVGLAAVAVGLLAFGVLCGGWCRNGRTCANCAPPKRTPACRSSGSGVAN